MSEAQLVAAVEYKSVQDSATDKIARLYNITMRGVTPQQLKSAKTPEEFARLLKKRGYYGPATFGTPAAEKEIKNYAAGVKLLMQRADIVELVTKNKNSILVGIVTIIAAIFLLRKKNK